MMRNKFLIVFALVSFFSSGFAEPIRLQPDEHNTVDIFQKFSPKVVFVHRYAKEKHHLINKARVPAGSGSGIIWDNKGHIVTNYHVVQGSVDLAVTINQKIIPAVIVGVAPHRDLAVLKVKSSIAIEDLKNFKPFEIAHISELLVGQKAIAIGNPFGLDHSLTQGVVSALNRQIPGATGVKIRDMIQTDAPVNPGNSGGPLLDSQGRLMGINTSIFSNSGTSAGVGFAVPADDIARIVPQLIHDGKLSLAGIGIRRVEPRFAEQLGIKKGILIEEVMPNTPAAKAGLLRSYRDKLGRVHVGDIIVGINGHEVHDYDELYNQFLLVKVGKRVTISVKREGKIVKVQMPTIDIASVKV